MDIDQSQLNELCDRIQMEWEKIKETLDNS